MNASRQASLFDETTTDPTASLVEVLARSQPAAQASKAQLTFQRLIAKIESQREQLKQWHAFEQRYQQRLAGELEPLQAKLHAGQRELAWQIDALLSGPSAAGRLGRIQRAKLRQLLLGLLRGLLDHMAEPTLEALHDRHAEVSYAQSRQSEVALTQAVLEEMWGVEVGADHGASTAEELLQHARRQMQERADAEAELEREQQAARAAQRSDASRAKAAAAQARRDQAAQEVSQSLREVYRKLAGALHPDRERDPVAHARKTQMMQRVNQAYAANDLLGLQLEIEQIDAAHLASVSPKRLAHFNQILREQLAELDAEIAHATLPFRRALGRDGPSAALTPAIVDRHLNADLAMLRAGLRQLRHDLVAFRDPANLRALLAHYELEVDAEPEDSAVRFSIPEPDAPRRRRARRG